MELKVAADLLAFSKPRGRAVGVHSATGPHDLRVRFVQEIRHYEGLARLMLKYLS